MKSKTKISANVTSQTLMITLIAISFGASVFAQEPRGNFRLQSAEERQHDRFPAPALSRRRQRSQTFAPSSTSNNFSLSESITNQLSPRLPETGQIRWKQSNGPETGTITRILAVDETVIAGTSGGIFLSTDHGRTWRYSERSQPGGIVNLQASETQQFERSATEPGPDTFISDLKTVGDAIFASDGLFTSTKGVWRSTDYGRSWTVSNQGLPAGIPVSRLGTVGNTILANVVSGLIYRSMDFGANWEVASTGLPEIQNASFASLGSTLLLGAPSDPRVFRSTDHAATWTALSLRLPDGAVPVSLGVTGNRFLVGTTGAGGFYSDDSGDTWHSITNGLPGDTLIYGWYEIGSSIYVISGKGDLFASNDQGDSWELRLAGFATAKAVYSLTGSGNAILAATSDGILRSNDHGRNWKASSSGLLAGEIYRHEVIGRHWFVGTSGGGFWRSSDKGASWKQINNGISGTDFQGVQSGGIVADGRTLFAGTFYPGNDGNFLYRSENLGETWTPITSVNALGNGVLDIYKIGGNLYISMYGGMVVSKDHGLNFEIVSGLPQDQWFDDFIKAGTTLFACSYGAGVFRSDDSGVRWQAMNDGLDQPNSMYVNGITSFGGSLFLGTDEGLYRSDNHGSYWYLIERFGGGVNDVKSLRQTLFASTYGSGVFTSDDDGQTWTSANRGLVGRRYFNFLRIGDRMAICSSGHGVSLSNSIAY